MLLLLLLLMPLTCDIFFVVFPDDRLLFAGACKP